MKLIPTILAGILSAAPAWAEDFPARQVDAIFAEWNRTDSPGCSLAIASGGDTAYTKGYGMASLEHGAPIRPDTVFYAGSVSKQFVAFSVALLAEEGKLSLDDDVRRWVPELPDYGQRITLRHLLHHTSGLRDYLGLWALSGRNTLDSIPADHALDLIVRQRDLNFAPGSEYSYSNSGYLLLALVAERAAGTSLREFAADRIFRPLGMASSHFHDDDAHVVPRRAEGYARAGNGGWESRAMRFALVGSGGLYTTVEDLIRWDGNSYANRLGSGVQSLIETVLTPGRLADGEALPYALGVVVGSHRGLETVRHGGALGGYRSHLVRFPGERFSVAVMCNLSDVDPGSLADQVADLLLGERMEPLPAPGLPGDPEASIPEPPGGDLSGFAGEYYCEELDAVYRLSVQENRLHVRAGFSPVRTLRRSGDLAFEAGFLTLEFQDGDPGRPAGFTLSAGRARNIGCRRR